MSVRKAQELQGGNHSIFGTQQYVEALNKEFHLSAYLLTSDTSYQYAEAIKNKCKLIQQVIDEIIEDLERNQKLLFQIPKENLTMTYHFLNGLCSFLSFARTSYTKVQKYTELLTKIQSPTYQSRASNKELQAAYDKLKRRRYQTSLSERQQKELIEKASRNGIRYTANGNAEILKFLQEVADRYDREFLSDLLTFEERILLQAKKTTEKRGKPLCSVEYIQQYEIMIFHGNLSRKHLNGKFSYGNFFQTALKRVGSSIIADLSRSKVGYHYVRLENQQRILDVTENLKKCGQEICQLKKSLDLFNIPDVTEALSQLMTEAIQDTKRIQREAKQEAKKIWDTKIKTQVKFIDERKYINNLSFCILLLKFKDLVGAKQKYDLKQKPEWKSNYFLFKGCILDFDAPGNVLYGVMVKETFRDLKHYGLSAQLTTYVCNMLYKYSLMGLTLEDDAVERLGHIGAGIAQIMDNNIWDTLQNSYTFYDDPRDFEAIAFGYDYYDQNELYKLRDPYQK